MSQPISLQVTTNLNELVQVLNWFDNIDHGSVPNIDWLMCKTALAEIFTNAVRHAHKNLPPETPITLEASLTEETIEIKVFDYGEVFDLATKLEKMVEADINATGGRGLHLINQVVDSFTCHQTADGRNYIQIRKKYLSTR
ncbi:MULTISPECIES: ATP-binding protein [Pseudanabaena]|uniref:Anti-sigma regulatory factor n=2 Tax=Pseudanabaena TaxID=1152 RepID=A0A9X4M6X5_9CYAN|nr:MULTISPECIES: ATP-binding protein [Pseudanabaena]ELS33913.1 putative anti-sigma regulatory factor, serine/threonine protein kinase [Pseudanabaena biceps PCC 7429]MDG3493878.1 anti-sigma regulatory factor [Pseudanabaena catenata USMAC16]